MKTIKSIILGISLFKISCEEFSYKREIDTDFVSQETAKSIAFLILPFEMLCCYYIGYFLGPYHLNFMQGLLLVIVLMLINKYLAKHLCAIAFRKKAYLEILSRYYLALPEEERKYYYSWNFRKNAIGIPFLTGFGLLIIGLLITPVIFPR